MCNSAGRWGATRILDPQIIDVGEQRQFPRVHPGWFRQGIEVGVDLVGFASEAVEIGAGRVLGEIDVLLDQLRQGLAERPGFAEPFAHVFFIGLLRPIGLGVEQPAEPADQDEQEQCQGSEPADVSPDRKWRRQVRDGGATGGGHSSGLPSSGFSVRT